ncbi:MAG: flagellar biosynthetic protein FliO [Burkholderiaceae bacterium]|jgi:flagellar protein FliO/FliZ|nr:flagellar biosynthetic protein FliO [Burkholderiaceae bacterium]
MGPLWPTLLLVVALVAAMAALPWLLRRLQQRTASLRGSAGLQSRVLGAVGIGPQQRVVTVEVGEGAQTVRLVLGVTAQNIQCLHVLQSPPAADFSSAMAQARNLPANGADHV